MAPSSIKLGAGYGQCDTEFYEVAYNTGNVQNAGQRSARIEQGFALYLRRLDT
jgi:hypothetical protein